MKKSIVLIAAFALMGFGLAACSQNGKSDNSSNGSNASSKSTMGTAQKAGAKIDNAVSATKKKVDDAMQKLQKPADANKTAAPATTNGAAQ